MCYSEDDVDDRPRENAHKTQRIYECKECCDRSETKNDFRDHYRIHLEKREKETDPKEADASYTLLFRCIPCDLVLPEVEIKKHRARHKQMRRNICDICGMIFTSRDSWATHKMKHVAEKTGDWFVCRMCGQTFPTQQRLKNHMRRHTKERPYVCEVCGKAFKSSYSLDRHCLVHSGVKPLSCEFCGKGFACGYNLKSHLRTHTGEKPYKCDVCNSSFTHNVSLKTHKRSAHGIDLWKIQKSKRLEEFDIDFDEIRNKTFERTKVETQTEKTAVPDENLAVKTAKDVSVEGKEVSTLQSESREQSTKMIPELKKEDVASTSEEFVSIPFRPLVDSSRVAQESTNSPQSGRDEAGFLPVLMNPFLMHNIQGMHPYNLSVHGGSDFDRRSGEPSSSQSQRATNQWTSGKQFTNL